MIEALIRQHPFVQGFVGQYREHVRYAAVRCISAELLNHLPFFHSDHLNGTKQWNVFFLDSGGKALHKVVCSADQREEEQGPGRKSVGREFLSLPKPTQDQIAFILVQEWDTTAGKREHHAIHITLYRPPARYSLREFIEELRDEIKWLPLDLTV